LVKEHIITFILNDYVVHDHIISHHLPHGLIAPYSLRVPNNSLSRLEHIKCPLHILPTSLLFTRKPLTFLFFRVVDSLHTDGDLHVGVSELLATCACRSFSLAAWYSRHFLDLARSVS
jgi:hypothetical protein